MILSEREAARQSEPFAPKRRSHRSANVPRPSSSGPRTYRFSGLRRGRHGGDRPVGGGSSPARGGDHQRGADRAAEIAEGGDLTAGGRSSLNRCGCIAVDDPLGQRLPEANAEPAADDHRLDVEQVDRRRDAGAERLDGTSISSVASLSSSLERARPDRARQPGRGRARSISLNRSVLAPLSCSRRARASIAARPA